ncbi:MAG: hypothetical protein HXS48_04145 [Theionarchaea archaeon]|nr:MAG: hypothetical protein AYK19_02300 [Theionarchaea archaeon DG-70-1]MBU7026112.1 hypothetical protein [Theionarchaea archaeon]
MNVLGLDVGSANVKYVAIDQEKREVIDSGCIPLWTQKISVLKKTVGAVKYITKSMDPASINVVTSFEVVEKKPVHALEAFYETLSNEIDVPLYTLTKECTLTDIATAQTHAEEFVTSALHGAAYAGTHILDNGIVMTMNSASTIVLPIIQRRYHPINDHKFSSGEARWLGVLFTPLEKVFETAPLNGRMTKLAPYGAHTGDIFNILNSSGLEKVLSLYGVDKALYSQEDSVYKIFHTLAYPLRDITEDIQTQAKLFSLYVYHNLENIIREMVIHVFSALNFDPDTTPIAACGIGKDLLLKPALRQFIVHDIEAVIPFPLWTYIEAFGSALALLEQTGDTHITITEVTTHDECAAKN